MSPSLSRRALPSLVIVAIAGAALAVLGALAAPSIAAASVSTGDGSWVWQNPQPVGVFMDAVSFVSATQGWAVGDGGAVLLTMNGGATWTAEHSGTSARLSLSLKATMAKGSYRWYVFATDAAGNTQSSVGTAKLTVK